MAEPTLDRLLTVTRKLTEQMPLEDALQLITDTTLELIPAEGAIIRLLDDLGSELISWARSGSVDDAPSSSFRPGEGITGWVCDSGRAAIISDAADDPRFVEGELGQRVGSAIAVPMLASGSVVGVLAASHPQAGRLGARDQLILRLLANCATPHIDRARVWRIEAVPQLEHALASPLRLRLTFELLEVGELGLSLEEAVICSGRYQQDVEACLRPMIRWGVIEHDGARYRLRTNLPEAVRTTIERLVEAGRDELGRERHVRHTLLGGMIGIDPKMQIVFELVRQVARIDVPVLITGETGTGKELVARATHDLSPRRKGFFGAVNCATLTETLFESQVFGHARGAFTGAVKDYVGLVERCNRGTLFLDEVGDLSLTNQVKLLRFLQEGSFTRLGETKTRSSDFRLISATNRELESMVAAGSFREDLYYRLAVFPVRIPSLRERLGDLKYLVEGILAINAQRFRTGGEPPTVTPEALRQLEQYNWPGNVRELENVMVRAVIMAGGGAIGPEHLPEVELLSDAPPESGIPPADTGELSVSRSLEDVQRDHIMSVLRARRGNIKATAEVLGISRTTLYKKIRDYQIDAPI